MNEASEEQTTPMKKELNKRENINFLVREFYAKVQEDPLLSPVFNSIVEDWPEHLERLTDFWETTLLRARSYEGNPVQVHQQVDRQMNNRINMEHFGRWLQLWYQTINEHFTGEYANLAKERARSISTHLFLRMYSSREQF